MNYCAEAVPAGLACAGLPGCGGARLLRGFGSDELILQGPAAGSRGVCGYLIAAGTFTPLKGFPTAALCPGYCDL